MRTGANNTLDEEPAESEFRRLLRMYGEPSNLNPPTDLVTRTARQLPAETPAQALRQVQIRRLARWAILGLFLLAVVLGIIILFAIGPATAPIGGQAGLGRTLLTLQLILKPLKGLLSMVGLPLLLIGIAAGGGSLLVVNRNPRAPHNLRAGV